MNWLDFFASIVRSLTSLAWPAAIVLCVWLFRAKLVELLPLLYVKHKDWEASFRGLLTRAEQEAKQLPKPQEVAAETPDENRHFDELERFSPRAAIVDKWEQLVQTASRASDLEKITDTPTEKLLRELKTIRNNVVHSPDEFSIEDAQRFRDLANTAISTIKSGGGRTPGGVPNGENTR